MNAREWVNESVARLEAAGVAEARQDIEWWASEALGIRREQIDTTFPDERLRERFDAGIERLARHEPLHYVIGHTPFLHLTLLTDARALIPRPETEELVMRVLGDAALWSRPSVEVVDVGTGTGCMAISIAARRPAAHVIALDCSEDALALARENARRNGMAERVTFQKGDLLAGFPENSADAIVSNPPYIATSVIGTLAPSVRAFEPMTALDGGVDGLAIIRILVAQAFTVLRNDGRLWLEIGDDQGDAVRDILVNAGFSDVVIACDMYGKTRFAEGIKCFRS